MCLGGICVRVCLGQEIQALVVMIQVAEALSPSCSQRPPPLPRPSLPWPSTNAHSPPSRLWLQAELELDCCVCGSSSGLGPSRRGRGRRPGTKLGRSQSGAAEPRHGRARALSSVEEGPGLGGCGSNAPTPPVPRMVMGGRLQPVPLPCPQSLSFLVKGGGGNHPLQPSGAQGSCPTQPRSHRQLWACLWRASRQSQVALESAF